MEDVLWANNDKSCGFADVRKDITLMRRCIMSRGVGAQRFMPDAGAVIDARVAAGTQRITSARELVISKSFNNYYDIELRFSKTAYFMMYKKGES